MRMREQDTVRAILQFLALHHIPAWRMSVGAFRAEHKGKFRFHRFGVPGMSDIIGVLPDTVPTIYSGRTGVFLAIEVKLPRGVPTPEQVAFLQTVTLAGGLGFVAHSVDEVKARLGL